MKRKSLLLISFLLLIYVKAALAQDGGWEFPSLGFGKGTWDASVGVFVWDKKLETRNLQFRSDLDLAPGLRWHTVIRSNKDMDTLKGWDPQFDENYLEGYGFHRSKDGVFSASLRIGNVRYLHFPYPDAIAVFDQVPGIADLKGAGQTGYSGKILGLEYAHKTGLGAHYTGIDWGFGRKGGAQTLENYLFYRTDWGLLHFEARSGRLAVRPEPLGSSDNGYNIYLGTNGEKYQVGFLYEKLKNSPGYTGIAVTFPMDNVTKTMGKVAFDYDRNPEGFALQVPLLSGTYGGIVRKAPEGAVLVGEIKAERLKTYWQNGQARNYYEHHLSQWGETGDKDLTVVMEEEPWYLQKEALVSPHTALGSKEDLKTWEKDRMGPAQLSQTVVYKFYRINK